MTTNLQNNSFQEHLAAMEAQIIALCEQDISIADFYRQMLELIVNGLGQGGAIWQIDSQGQYNCIAHMNLSLAGLDAQGYQNELLSKALQYSAQNICPLVLPENNNSNVLNKNMNQDLANKSNNSLVFVPIIIRKGQVGAVLVLIAPQGIDPRALKGYANFIAGLCDRAGFFLLKQEIRIQEKAIGYSDRLRQYSAALHSTLEPRRVCYALANYAQEILGVYRCMAGTFNARGKFKMLSVSGLESVAVKSSFIKTISEICKFVCINGKPLIVDNPNAAMGDISDADELLTAARCYMLEARAAMMGIFPVMADEKVVGVLVVERAQELPFDDSQLRDIEVLTSQASSAINNALQYRDMPLSLLTRMLAAVRNKIYAMPIMRKAVWLCIWAALFTLPAIIQMPLKTVGSAELIAVDGRNIYAATDGRLEQISVKEGDIVKAGTVLAWLDSRSVDSMIDITNSKIRQKQQVRNDASARGDVSAIGFLDLELAELQTELNEHQRQKEQYYQVIAPVDGRIFTQQNRINKLLGQPLTRGQAVLEIVPQDSQWEFLVNVPEDQAGDLLKADFNQEQLKAHILMLASPDVIYAAEVMAISPRAHIETTGQQKYRNVISLRVAAPPELIDIIELRQGMKASVAIESGRKSLYYVVTRQFADFWRVNSF